MLVESGLWKEPRKARKPVRAPRDRGEAAAALSTSGAELAIVLTDDSAIRLLNRDGAASTRPRTCCRSRPRAPADEPPLIGDIVLAYETIAREARAERKPFAHHLAHLAVHGFLHLLGYDHERKKDAEAMERLGAQNPAAARNPRSLSALGQGLKPMPTGDN